MGRFLFFLQFAILCCGSCHGAPGLVHTCRRDFRCTGWGCVFACRGVRCCDVILPCCSSVLVHVCLLCPCAVVKFLFIYFVKLRIACMRHAAAFFSSILLFFCDRTWSHRFFIFPDFLTDRSGFPPDRPTVVFFCFSCPSFVRLCAVSACGGRTRPMNEDEYFGARMQDHQQGQGLYQEPQG